MQYTVPLLKKMSPQLPVTQIEHSIEFYTKKLGFSLDFQYEDFYAGIVKDGHSIHLKSGTSPGKVGKNKDELDIIFSVDSIERLYEEFLNKSIEIVQPLRDMPYGREFYIADPDGNHIAFIEETWSYVLVYSRLPGNNQKNTIDIRFTKGLASWVWERGFWKHILENQMQIEIGLRKWMLLWSRPKPK
jgi:predicted enzyme related to lactoylglutathione lyase